MIIILLCMMAAAIYFTPEPPSINDSKQTITDNKLRSNRNFDILKSSSKIDKGNKPDAKVLPFRQKSSK